ncbi:MAG TPA: hypothetical protein VI685_10225 [Candidatus Angelobacter sp.]
MPTVQVDSLRFTFLLTVAAECYDKWQHYNNVWNTGGRNQKAMDVVAVETPAAPATTWLIEAKDFRVVTRPPRHSHIAGLAQTVATKTEHTLRGLEDAAVNATLASERNHANIAIAAHKKRVVLHLEPHTGPRTALFPRGFEASVLQKLRQLVKATDPNPLVLKTANTAMAGVPWTVV